VRFKYITIAYNIANKKSRIKVIARVSVIVIIYVTNNKNDITIYGKIMCIWYNIL
jgi:hypothetical protein